MFRSHWRFVLAAFGCLILALPNGIAHEPIDITVRTQPIASESNGTAGGNASPSPSLPPENMLLPPAGNIAPPMDDQAKAAREERRADDDLKAQQEMANWTFWMLVVAGLQLGFGIGGIWLVYQTLKATRDAVREAEEATKAANASVAIAADSADRQLRAYVDVDEALLRWNGGKNMEFVLICRNTGQTPAKSFDIWYVIDIGDANNANDTMDKESLTKNGPWNSLGGGRSLSVRISPDNSDILERNDVIKNLESLIYFRGFVRYEDILGTIYESEFIFHTRTQAVKMPDVDGKMSRGNAKLRVYEKVQG
jgi:hypothetical protein